MNELPLLWVYPPFFSIEGTLSFDLRRELPERKWAHGVH